MLAICHLSSQGPHPITSRARRDPSKSLLRQEEPPNDIRRLKTLAAIRLVGQHLRCAALGLRLPSRAR